MEYYSWILTFHILSFTSWMAMLFYMPRLFVYHQEHKENKGFVEVVKIQELKLYKFIGVPAFWATLLSGAVMIMLNSALLSMPWFQVKLFFLVLLIVYHFSMNYFRKELEAGRCKKSGKFFRFYNEVPTLLMIVIVVMVIIKPF